MRRRYSAERRWCGGSTGGAGVARDDPFLFWGRSILAARQRLALSLRDGTGRANPPDEPSMGNPLYGNPVRAFAACSARSPYHSHTSSPHLIGYTYSTRLLRSAWGDTRQPQRVGLQRVMRLTARSVGMLEKTCGVCPKRRRAAHSIWGAVGRVAIWSAVLCTALDDDGFHCVVRTRTANQSADDRVVTIRVKD